MRGFFTPGHGCCGSPVARIQKRLACGEIQDPPWALTKSTLFHFFQDDLRIVVEPPVDCLKSHGRGVFAGTVVHR